MRRDTISKARILFSVLLYGVLVLPSAYPETEGSFSSRSQDRVWKSAYETELEARSAELHVSPASLRLVHRFLGESQAPADPLRAAERVSSLAEALDADLRRGLSPVTATAAYRQMWRASGSGSGEGEFKKNGAMKALKNKLAEKNIGELKKETELKPTGAGRSQDDGPGKEGPGNQDGQGSGNKES